MMNVCSKINCKINFVSIKTCLLILFSGRREFIQRLKLEATLNVHDGCVSDYLCVYKEFVSFLIMLEEVKEVKYSVYIFNSQSSYAILRLSALK